MIEQVLNFANKEMFLFNRAYFVNNYNDSKIYIVFPIDKNFQFVFVGVNKDNECFIPDNNCCSYIFEFNNKKIQEFANQSSPSDFGG